MVFIWEFNCLKMKYFNGIIDSVSRGYNADAAAFFARVTAAGGSLTLTEKNAVNTLVISLKVNNLWTSMKAIYPMVGSSAAACAQNLKSSSFTGSFSGGWTYASTGVKPNGTNGFMNTGFIANNNLTLNSGHLSFYSRTNNNTGIDDFSAIVATDTQNMRLIIKYSDNFLYNDLNNAASNRITVANSDSLGFYISSRLNSTSLKVYKNSSNIATNTVSNGGTQPTINIYLGAANQDGIMANLFSNRECAMASLGNGLSDIQAANFYTYVQTFQTSLSRQV